MEAEGILVLNGNQPAKPNLSEVDTADMKQFLNVIKLILSSVGIGILDSKKKVHENNESERQQEIFEFSSKGAKGKMIIVFIPLKTTMLLIVQVMQLLLFQVEMKMVEDSGIIKVKV